MAFTEDFSTFLADFGDDGTLDGVAVRGIFDAPSAAQALGNTSASAQEPQFQLPTASVPAGVFNKVLTVPQGSYRVHEHLPDGTGMSLLLLTKA